jgi:hypothetical protein
VPDHVLKAVALLGLLSIGCSHRDPVRPADDCQRFVDKAWRLLPEVAPTKITPEEFLAGCRKQAAVPVVRCVAEARGDEGVRRCLEAGKEAISQAAVDGFAAQVFGDARLAVTPDAAEAVLKIRYAAKTEVSAAGTNPTYFSIVEDAALFIVADSDNPAASKLAAEAMAPFPSPDCPGAATDDDAQMRCALDRVNARLVRERATVSIAAVTVRGHQAVVAFAGDVPVLLRQGAKLGVLAPAAPSPPLGSAPSVKPDLQTIELSSSDTIVIANRGLLRALGPTGVAGALPAGPSTVQEIEHAVEQIVDAAKRVPRHDALSLILVHLVAAPP